MHRHKQILFACAMSALLILSACTPAAQVAKSTLNRIQDPLVEPSEKAQLVEGNTAFAFDLYQAVKSEDGNLFYSPFSISLALVMTYAGAGGETAAQMADTLRFSLDDENLHAAFNALDLELAARSEQAVDVDEENRFELSIVNSLWGQVDWPFLSDFLDLLAVNYGAGMRLVDYVNQPEAARLAINDWVSDQTRGRIQDLITQGMIDSLTRLVLVNAIYFKAAWEQQFAEEITQDSPFSLLDGSQISVPTMSLAEPAQLLYASGDGYQAVALPYQGGSSEMIIILPDEGNFASFEASMDSEVFEGILQSLQPQMMMLNMPKFSFTSEYQLSRVLPTMGMVDAFSPALADFSGMDGARDLYISEVVHKAFVTVDESGTEAAAATAVMMRLTAALPVEFVLTIDHPFIFIIRDIPSQCILFIGRVVNPE